MFKIKNMTGLVCFTLATGLLISSCAKEQTSVKVTPNPTLPDNINDVPPTQNPGTGEKLTTDPICTIPLNFPIARSAADNESILGELIVQPTWTPTNSKIQAPKDIEPPTMICLFVETNGARPKASIRIEYEDRYGRVQYTLKDHPDLDYANQANANTAPPVKRDANGNNVIYRPSYYVDLSENKFEIFFMPTWGFIQIKGKKEADGYFYAKIQYIKFLNAPIEPYYLTYSNDADATKIQHCTGDDGQNSLAKIIHPDRSAQPPVDCVRSHRLVRSAFHGPWDKDLGIFRSHDEYTGNRYDYRVDMIRQYTNESPESLADFMTVTGQKPVELGTIKFLADKVWSGVAP